VLAWPAEHPDCVVLVTQEQDWAMPIHQYFASTYIEAREKFLEAAKAANATVSRYAIPKLRGPENEELVMDVARVGSPNPESLLMLISGTHGVEGFCGSGCQVGYLTDRLYEAMGTKSATILLHALNPFGFAWLRRANEDNIDVNRNFQDFSKPLPLSPAYDALHSWLIPEDWDGSKRIAADAALDEYKGRKGAAKFQGEVSGGQYTHPNGLFYGGGAESWSNRTLRQILAELATSSLKQLAVLDLHSGLGPPGFGEAIYPGVSSEEFERAKKWYGTDLKSTTVGTSVSAQITGSVADAFPRDDHFEVTYLALEFGTVPMNEVLTALRADHWLHAGPERKPHWRGLIGRQMRSAFYVDTSWWKAAVYGRTADLALRATRAMS